MRHGTTPRDLPENKCQSRFGSFSPSAPGGELVSEPEFRVVFVISCIRLVVSHNVASSAGSGVLFYGTLPGFLKVSSDVVSTIAVASILACLAKPRDIVNTLRVAKLNSRRCDDVGLSISASTSNEGQSWLFPPG